MGSVQGMCRLGSPRRSEGATVLNSSETSPPPRCARRSARVCTSSQHRHSLARRRRASSRPRGTRSTSSTGDNRRHHIQLRLAKPIANGCKPLGATGPEDEVRAGSASLAFQVSRFGAPKERRSCTRAALHHRLKTAALRTPFHARRSSARDPSFQHSTASLPRMYMEK